MFDPRLSLLLHNLTVELRWQIRQRMIPTGQDEGIMLATASSLEPATKSEPSRLIQGPFAWPRRFFERHPINYDSENNPWNLYRVDLNCPEDEISFFLCINNNHARYEGRVRPVLDICFDTSLQDLLESDDPGPIRKVAWLIDGNWSENIWSCRPCVGALSARQLTSELLKKASLTHNFKLITEGALAETLLQRYPVPKDLDSCIPAERRLM